MLSKRACINRGFSATDERSAAKIFRHGVSLDEIEQAIALACCRKYVGLISGTDNEVIRRFSYFRDAIEEVRDPEAHPKQPELLKQRILSVEILREEITA